MPSIRLASAASLLLPALFLAHGSSDIQTFQNPVDAISVTLPSEDATARLSYFANGAWSAWETLHVENEQDPTLRESQLIMFPEGVTKLRIDGDTSAVHPVEISEEPVHYDVAATNGVGRPRILSRSEWGADESFLLRTKSQQNTADDDKGSDSSEVSDASQRAKDCAEDQLNWPEEFKTVREKTTNPDGVEYRWPQEYSADIKMLVVHHTAVKVTGDTRSGEERVRALYAYHANNRAWGDIGYHYLVDEDGQIYEGRAGGKYVVGGHAYCNNVNTIGVALLGSFNEELPSQAQVKSLQWLLAYLGDTYEIPMAGKIRFHGDSLPTIVGHRDLLTTDCPGDYMYDVLGQVRTHVAQGDVDDPVTFPRPASGNYTDRTAERRQQRAGSQAGEPLRVFPKEGISPLGTTSLTGRPGQQILVSMRYQAGSMRVQRAANIAEVNRSAPGIGLWQEKGGVFTRVATNLNAPSLIAAGGTSLIRLKIQFPSEAGSYTMTVGQWTYQLEVSGRRSRGTPTESQYQEARSSSSRISRPVRSSSSSSSVRSRVSQQPSEGVSPYIRIRLTQTTPGGSISIEPMQKASMLSIATANMRKTDRSAGLAASADGKGCSALGANGTVTGDAVRFTSDDGIIRINNFSGQPRLVRGVVECRMVDGALTLINELPLEEYLWGLAEEPDTEPYQKQRAFAITARTYAAFYMDPANRKFPGKPYDGSDSPAEFQAYKGYDFETTHTMWLKAVKQTAGTILTKGGKVIKPPYFSSDDGRTRTPQEAGWGNSFPFAEIYTSKPDPWCKGMENRGHGVGMSGCGAEGQANEGKSAEDILAYYYPGTVLSPLR